MGSKTILAVRCEAALHDIEETRRRIGDRAGLLQDRLKPRAAFKPLTKRLQGTLGKGGEKILDAFRDNPIPLALTGVGIAWLLLDDLQGRPRQEAAGAAPGKVRRGVDKVSGWFSTTLEENPMALAVAALALGAVAGLCFPASRQEEPAAPAPPEPQPASTEVPPPEEAPD